MKIIDHLVKSVRDAAVYNPEIAAPPACILWPDRDRQWEAVMTRLQAELPELLILGDYDPEQKVGPAIWLRCVIGGTVSEVELPEGVVSIFYLPGVSRQDLRAVESCPDHLKPLAELQYRGVIWSQVNAKDWTILAYLKSDQGGLGLDTAQDKDAKNSMQLALYRFLDEDVDLLKGKRLDKDYFNTLLTGGDPTRDLLQWMDQGEGFREARSDNEWKAFVSVCKSQLAFDPQKEGGLAAAVKLAAHEGPWHTVWERFCEAPKRYPAIPGLIRKCRPPHDNMLWHMGGDSFSGWPQWNEDQEKKLYQDLMGLQHMPSFQAGKKLLDLEQLHGPRRGTVWAELGEAPLALALEHLAGIARGVKTTLAAGTPEDVAAGYRQFGWEIDDCVLKALAVVDSNGNLEAVRTAIRAVYMPWAEDAARHLQRLVDGKSYPGGTRETAASVSAERGECILFVDGLRFDTAKRLVRRLQDTGLETTEEPVWCALPSVTGTGKPAVAPIKKESERLEEEPDGYNFEVLTNYHLHKAIEENGVQVLSGNDNGDPSGMGWCEFGDIDREGHNRGWKLARHLDALLEEIRERITGLLDVGWKRVRVVTDHGWLLLPGGLPKIELPAPLSENKWGRCASLKEGAVCQERMYPWYWNPDRQFALADGISCFKSGEEYTHGGLSLQECLTLRLVVTGDASSNAGSGVRFSDVGWKGLRCSVAVEGNGDGLTVDIREHAGEPSSSVVIATRKIRENGTASVVVEDDDLEGSGAAVVLLDEDGALIAQSETVIGGGGR